MSKVKTSAEKEVFYPKLCQLQVRTASDRTRSKFHTICVKNQNQGITNIKMTKNSVRIKIKNCFLAVRITTKVINPDSGRSSNCARKMALQIRTNVQGVMYSQKMWWRVVR